MKIKMWFYWSFIVIICLLSTLVTLKYFPLSNSTESFDIIKNNCHDYLNSEEKRKELDSDLYSTEMCEHFETLVEEGKKPTSFFYIYNYLITHGILGFIFQLIIIIYDFFTNINYFP